MPEILIKFTPEEWNDLVEANDPLVESLISHIDERDVRVNNDYTIKLKVGGKKVKILSPRERAKRDEDDEAAAVRQKTKALQDEKDLKEDRELIAKLWAKSYSLKEVYQNLRDMNAAGPISKKRDAVFALNNDKKFLKDFELNTLPTELESFVATKKALKPKVLSQLGIIFTQMIHNEEEGHLKFSDFEGRSTLQSIMTGIADGKEINEEEYAPKVQSIIMDFFESKIDICKESGSLVPEVYIMPGNPPTEVIFTLDFMKMFQHEL
jgi:hypothetical protein